MRGWTSLEWKKGEYHKIRKIGTHRNKHPLNKGTHFDYNNFVTLISTHIKIGTPQEKAPVAVQMEVNIVAYFLPVAPILSKLS